MVLSRNFFISFFLLITFFSISANHTEKDVCKEEESLMFTGKIVPKLQAMAAVAGGVSLALLAHIATEYPIVLTHEYGHVFGNILSGGVAGRVIIDSNYEPIPKFINTSKYRM